jgi:hypothetical protein
MRTQLSLSLADRWRLEFRDDPDSVDKLGFNHQPKAGFLRAEAEKEGGCPLCALLWRGLTEDADSVTSDQSDTDTYMHRLLDFTIPESFNEDNPVKVLLNPAEEGDDHRGNLRELQVYCTSTLTMGYRLQWGQWGSEKFSLAHATGVLAMRPQQPRFVGFRIGTEASKSYIIEFLSLKTKGSGLSIDP